MLGGDQVPGGPRGSRLRQGDDRRQEGEGALGATRFGTDEVGRTSERFSKDAIYIYMYIHICMYVM